MATAETDPEMSTRGQISPEDSAQIVGMLAMVKASESPDALTMAVRDLVRMQASILKVENRSVESHKAAMIDAARGYVRAYYRRCTILCLWRESLSRVAGESVIETWESELGMAMGNLSASTVRRWMREGRDPVEWWDLIEAQAAVLGGKTPAITTELTRRRKEAKLLAKREDEDEPIEGLDALLGVNPKPNAPSPVREHIHGAPAGAPSPPDSHPYSPEDAEREEAQTILELLGAETFREAVDDLRTIINEHAKLIRQLSAEGDQP